MFRCESGIKRFNKQHKRLDLYFDNTFIVLKKITIKKKYGKQVTGAFDNKLSRMSPLGAA